MRSRLGALPLSVLCLGMLWAGAASGLSYTMADVNFSVGGASGTIQLVGGSEGAGPTGATLSGTPGVTDDLVIFRVVMSSGSVVEVGIGAVNPGPSFITSSGSGTVAGPDVNVVNGAITATGTFTRTFSFDSDGNTVADSLSGTSTSDSFWVTFANLADGATVNFMVNDGSTQATVQGIVTLPEPATLVLLVLAAGALTIRRFLRG